MSSIPLYKAFIEVGASEESATQASEDVIQVSQLPQLATKADIVLLEKKITADTALLEKKLTADIVLLEKKITADIALLQEKLTADTALLQEKLTADTALLQEKLTAAMAKQESRLIKWMVGSLFVFATIILAGGGILFQILLSSGVAQ